jgi:hypothetical protein
MKFFKLTLTFALLVVMTSTTMAQFAAKNSPTPAPSSSFGLFEKADKMQRFSFFLNYGAFPISVKESSVNFSYKDESPSPSTISQTINLKKSTSANGISGGIEWQTRRNLIFRVLFGGGKGSDKKTSASSFTFGAGYAFGSPRFQVYPIIDFVASNGNMNLANLKGDGYVIINEQEFNSSAISTKLSTSFSGFKPAVGLHYSITKKIGINAHAGWLVGKANGTTKLEFSETNPTKKDANGNSVTTSASELLSEPNVKFEVNNIREDIRTSIFNAGGLTWSIGISIDLKNRLRDDD